LNQNKNKFYGEERKNKIYSILETKLEANILQNTRILETWKLLTKYKIQYFSKILRVEKPIKGHKHQGEERELHRVFLVSFLLCNSFVLPPHGRLNLFG